MKPQKTSLFWCRLGLGIVLVSVQILFLPLPGLYAADPAFVGTLALAVEPDGIQRLELSEQVVKDLRALITQRENEAINLALEIRELPPTERAKRLEPFIAESERLGMALLTVEQRSKLDHFRIQRAGMLTLAQPNMVKLLSLTQEQTGAIQKLMAERAEAMTQGGEQQRRITRDTYERKLRSLLTDIQKATWDRLAGLGPGPQDVAAAATSQQAASPAEDGGAEPEKTAASTSVATEAPADTAPPTLAEAAGENATAETTDPSPEEGTVAEMESASPSADVVETPLPETPLPETPAPTTLPSAEPATSTAAVAESPTGEPQLRFNFRFQPWGDVLDWLAEQADLSLQSDLVPEGTFNYSDSRSYSATQAIDLINGVLLTKGYTLVRRGRLLTVINLDDEIPDVLVEFVPVEELDDRGEFELIKTVFHLAKMEPTDAQQEIQQMLGPGRSLIVMPKARQIMVTETAGNLRAIRDVLERAENPASDAGKLVTEIKLQNASAEEVMLIARPLLGLSEGENVGEEISIAIDVMGTRLFATGSSDKIAILENIVKSVDGVVSGDSAASTAALEQLQLLTHPIQVADPDGALAVLQTLLAGSPDVRLAMDPKTSKIIALARPSEHATIVEVIKQLEGEEAQFEVIQLRRIDPQLAVLTISNFFGSDEETSNGIKLDADPTTMKLYLRATKTQVAQIKDLIEKLEGSGGSNAVGSNLRYVPLTGDSARSTVEMAKRLWSGQNQIHFNEPSSSGPSSFDLREVSPGPTSLKSQPFEMPVERPPVEPARPAATGKATTAPLPVSPSVRGNDRTAKRQRTDDSIFRLPVHLVSQTVAEEEEAIEAVNSEAVSGEAVSGEAVSGEAVSGEAVSGEAVSGEAVSGEAVSGEAVSGEDGAPVAAILGKGTDINIEFTPEGILIASEDTEALDEFEDLLRTIAGPQSLLPGKNFTVFFLKYCKAEVAQQMIQEILGGSSAASGGSLVGDMASSLLGGGGGILGALMGGGGGSGQDVTTIQATGPVSIVADPRLNCLVVQAVQVDLQLIEQLLKVIDREASITEVQTAGKPHIIPVVYMQAEEVAAVVREAYASRLATKASQGQRQPSPADMIRALRGGGRGGSEKAKSEESKMTLAVDVRSNSLIVTAPEPLYLEVKELVAQIDMAGLDQVEDVRVVTLAHTTPEAIQKALGSILQTSSGSSGNAASRSSSSQRPGGSSAGGASADDIRRRMEFIQRMRAGGGGQPGGMSRGGGSPRGGSPRGGSPRGNSRGGSSRGGRGGR